MTPACASTCGLLVYHDEVGMTALAKNWPSNQDRFISTLFEIMEIFSIVMYAFVFRHLSWPAFGVLTGFLCTFTIVPF